MSYTTDTSESNNVNINSVYDFKVKDIYGNIVSLEKYKGHVCIIVNVASQCGLTETNYDQLNYLYSRYGKSRGLRILAFPSNQFLSQEPGTDEDILNFVRSKGVQFDVFSKINVNGDDAHPLWKYLKSAQKGTFGDFIKWNFSKFIIDKNGRVVERYAPTTNPNDMVEDLEKYFDQEFGNVTDKNEL
ncbi:hypothetical protein GWI33_000723 [Rhynchophorus ferrugineus]|uniref:Glutathione peroxidase n=1 Tax=Rhynchophorus ferrugineus TaxID=354439 RepID=A0A834ISX7_RHYFE|nr:hypothetical protein GWI33_000723 [Rhynchophorus ferrugineus]